MCLMAPALVVGVQRDACDVAWGDGVEHVSTLFLDGALLAPGDWVLVLGGNTVRRLDPDTAAAMRAALGISSDERTNKQTGGRS